MHPSHVQTSPHCFLTTVDHFSNPADNMLATTTNLVALPITGNTPFDIEARNAIDMLKTTVAQQANYSYSQQRLHSTPHPSHIGVAMLTRQLSPPVLIGDVNSSVTRLYAELYTPKRSSTQPGHEGRLKHPTQRLISHLL